MNRWQGSARDSLKQASERSQRAARRTISSLDLVLSEEEEFQDCDTSLRLTNLNLDGAGDDLDDTTSSSTTSQVMAPDPVVRFDEANTDDDSEAWKKDLKVKFDRIILENPKNNSIK